MQEHLAALKQHGFTEHTILQAHALNITPANLLDWITRYGPTAVQLITEIVNQLHGTQRLVTPE